MDPLRVFLISDNYPGHFNFADGVLAAIEKLRPVDCEKLSIGWRFPPRMRAVRPLVYGGPAALRLLLKVGYGIAAKDLPDVDLVISGGGNTIAANIAAARLLGVKNIFCGSLRGGMQYDQFSLVVTSYEKIKEDPRHIATLKPSIFDPRVFSRPPRSVRYGPENRPARAGLLLGGDSGYFRYRREEWPELLRFVRALSAAWGTRWLISTSRRTPNRVADLVADLAKDESVVERFIDFRTAGPGTLFPIFRDADIMVCTTDSSSMLSEAIAVHLPVIGITPRRHGFKPDEARHREMMLQKNWARFIPLSELNVERFSAALAEVEPPDISHLDLLARQIKLKLPSLFAEAAPRKAPQLAQNS